MVQLTHKRASVNGVSLHYVTVGSGPAVLCLHGWPQNKPYADGTGDVLLKSISQPKVKALRTADAD